MLNTIVLGVVVPMLVCSAVLIVAWWLRDRGCLIRATALGLGYLSCQLIVDGWPAFPPHETWQWLFALVFTVAGGGGNYIWKTWKVRQATGRCNPLELHSAQQIFDRMKREISQKSS